MDKQERVVSGSRLFRWVLLTFLMVMLSVDAQEGIEEIVVTQEQLSFTVNTVGKRNDIVEANAQEDFLSFGGGQIFFRWSLEGLDRSVDVIASTCEFANFNTSLLLLRENPLEVANARVALSNRHDLSCGNFDGMTPKRSTIEYRTNVEADKELFFVLTGANGEEGEATVNFNLSEIVQENGSWGLDRIDQRKLPRDLEYTVTGGGNGVFAYIIDSGIRVNHTEFRKSGDDSIPGTRAGQGKNFVEPDLPPFDCNGHGTHVAALLGGRNVGVTSATTLIPVKVLDCDKEGTSSDVLAAIDWILEDITNFNRFHSLVVMSVLSKFDAELNRKVEEKLFDNFIPIIAAAGNFVDGESTDSCDSSPGSLTSVITVSASDQFDRRASFSKYGKCTNIYAPGSGIRSAFHTGDHAYRELSGTSQAVPFVAGAVALLQTVNDGISAAEINDVIVALGTKDVLDLGNDEDDANVLTYVRNVPRIPAVKIPPEQAYNFYFIFRFAELEECSEGDNARLSDAFNAWLQANEAEYQRAVVFRCEEIESPFDEVNQASGVNIQFETLVEIVKAAETYQILEDGILEETLQKSLKTDTNLAVSEVVELPWVVDSRGYSFWAAPVLPPQEQGISTGLTVGIVLASVTLVVAALVLILLVKRWTKPAEVEDEICKPKSESNIFEDKKSPRPKNKKNNSLLSGKTSSQMQYISQGPEAFARPLNGVDTNLSASYASYDGRDAVGDDLEVQSLTAGEGVINYRGDEDDGPLHTQSFGSQAALFGGGLSGDVSFVDLGDLVDDVPATTTKDNGRVGAVDETGNLQGTGLAGGNGTDCAQDLEVGDEPKLRTDSFGDVKLDEDRS